MLLKISQLLTNGTNFASFNCLTWLLSATTTVTNDKKLRHVLFYAIYYSWRKLSAWS
jgi:hypothetical protein